MTNWEGAGLLLLRLSPNLGRILRKKMSVETRQAKEPFLQSQQIVAETRIRGGNVRK
jgi:hypothetical protein